MTAITVANTAWEIIDDLKDALAGTTVSGVAVFKQANIAASVDYAMENGFKGTQPLAYVILDNIEKENEGPEYVLWCQVSVTLLVATTDGDTDAEKLENIMYDIAAAKNAIEAAPPSDAAGGGDGDHYHRSLEWGEPTIDTDEKDPWSVVTIPLAVGYVLDDRTSH